MLLSMMHVSMIHVSMIHLSMMNVFLDAYIYDGGTLSVTEEKKKKKKEKKKDFYSSSIRLGLHITRELHEFKCIL